MWKKSKAIKNRYGRSNKKNIYISSAAMSILLFASLFLLSGCAKTGYPQPPKIIPPRPPVIISVKKLNNALRIIYKYNGNINKIKGFLIYKKYYKNKKSVKYSCASSKPFVFQNLKFIKKFSLQYDKFFYNVNKNNLKNGYYLFCAKSVGNYDIESAYSNYIIAAIIMLK
jgi:hypothetical protein